jgi:hypothetical protein
MLGRQFIPSVKTCQLRDVKPVFLENIRNTFLYLAYLIGQLQQLLTGAGGAVYPQQEEETMTDIQSPNLGWTRNFFAVVLTCIALIAFAGESSFAAPPNTMPVWRAQIRVVTGSNADAGSDDNVKVQLRNGNAIWLESGWNDFEANTDMYYDLRLEGIDKLGDIDFLRIEKTGSDGWQIRKIELLINGWAIYSETFPGGGLWLDNDDGHSRVFYKDDLFMRSRPAWTTYVRPPRPSILSMSSIMQRVEALVGNFAIEDSDVLMDRQDAGSVEASTYDGDTWQVDLDLEEHKALLPNNPDLDTDLKLSVGCSPNRNLHRLVFSVSDVKVESGWPRDASGKVHAFVTGPCVEQLNDMMKGFTFLQPGPSRCPFLVLASNGDLNIIPQFEGPNNTIILRRERERRQP